MHFFPNTELVVRHGKTIEVEIIVSINILYLMLLLKDLSTQNIPWFYHYNLQPNRY